MEYLEFPSCLKITYKLGIVYILIREILEIQSNLNNSKLKGSDEKFELLRFRDYRGFELTRFGDEKFELSRLEVRGWC